MLDQFSEKSKKWTIVVLIVIACAAIYGQTVGFDFINIDDRPYVWDNPMVRQGLTWDSVKWAFTTGHAGNWHPLTWLSHIIDSQLFQGNAGWHHFTNLLLHTANSVLVFVVFNTMTRRIWSSAVIALLFAVHPAHVESVAWVAERKDLLCAFFWLLTMLFYIWYSTDETHSKKWLFLAIFTLVLGAMSKPMIVTLPFVLLLCDLWPLNRLSSKKSLVDAVIEKIPMFIIITASSVITYLVQSAAGATGSFQHLTFGERLINALAAYTKYLIEFFAPLHLGIFYPLDPPSNLPWAFAGAAMIALVSAGVYIFRSHRYLFTGWLWFLGTLVPVIGIVQVGGQSMADRYTYIPFIGLFIIIVFAFDDLIARLKLSSTVVGIISMVVISALGVRAFDQTTLWRTSEGIYLQTLAHTKNNYFIQANLCLHYFNNADAAIAERECSQLLADIPPTPDSFNILGVLKLKNNKPEEALKLFGDGLATGQRLGVLHINRAVALSKLGRTDEAISELSLGRSLPDSSFTSNELAKSYILVAKAAAAQQRIPDAKKLVADAALIDPNNLEAKKLIELYGQE